MTILPPVATMLLSGVVVRDARAVHNASLLGCRNWGFPGTSSMFHCCALQHDDVVAVTLLSVNNFLRKRRHAARNPQQQRGIYVFNAINPFSHVAV